MALKQLAFLLAAIVCLHSADAQTKPAKLVTEREYYTMRSTHPMVDIDFYGNGFYSIPHTIANSSFSARFDSLVDSHSAFTAGNCSIYYNPREAGYGANEFPVQHWGRMVPLQFSYRQPATGRTVAVVDSVYLPKPVRLLSLFPIAADQSTMLQAGTEIRWEADAANDRGLLIELEQIPLEMAAFDTTKVLIRNMITVPETGSFQLPKRLFKGFKKGERVSMNLIRYNYKWIGNEPAKRVLVNVKYELISTVYYAK